MKLDPVANMPGCLAALVLSAAMVGVTYVAGGVLFSPGPLSAQGAGRPPLKGFSSHADFEDRCGLCHAPWTGITATLCENCHTNITEERQAGTGIHGAIQNSLDCQQCHIEHGGRQADQTAAAMAAYPHDQTGYSLVKHRTWPNDGRPFTCSDCHKSDDPRYSFDQSTCENCHRQIDPVYTGQHVAKYSTDCLPCHRELKPVDHAAFPLQLGHAGLQCSDCHKQNNFAQTKTDCIACHEDPAIHAGSFGTDCAVCHTISGWLPARLEKHTFPVDHGGKGEIDCVTCHVKSYATYTCYNCHDHIESEVDLKHIKKGVVDSADCMKCHPDGHTRED